jgi:hypothetical protein
VPAGRRGRRIATAADRAKRWPTAKRRAAAIATPGCTAADPRDNEGTARTGRPDGPRNSPFSGMSVAWTVSSSTAIGAAPWFHITTGTLKTVALAWGTHLHSEIAGLAPNSTSSPLIANLATLVLDDRRRLQRTQRADLLSRLCLA